VTTLEKALSKGAPLPDSGAPAQAARALAASAAADGVADVAYAMEPTPFGEMLVAASRRGLVRITFPGADVDAVLEVIAAQVSPRIVEAPESLDDTRRQLDEYFAGRRRAFEVPLDWRVTRGFSRRVLRATARIPHGDVSTYREVAARAGSPAAVRAAGNALASNAIPIVIPCHRVLRSDGSLGGYGGGLDRKRFLLELERRAG
jgi:methylated-DNA-[protein]-cysteine S-methyltransferase